MKILYIHQHFKRPDQAGGSRPYQFARRFSAAGHDVTIICAGESRTSYTIEGFRVEQLAVAYDNRMSVSRRLVSFASFMLRATALATQRPADVVFASSTPLTVIIPGIVAALRNGSGFVLEIRDLWPAVPIALGKLPRLLHWPARALEKLGYKAAHCVVALSPEMAAGVRSADSHAAVVVVPNSADLVEANTDRDVATIRQRYAPCSSDKLLVYAGSLGVIYRPVWLAQLAIAIQGTPWRLVVAGDGVGLAQGKRHLEGSGIMADSVFLGPLSRAEALGLVAASDAVVSSLIEEPALEGSSLNKAFDAMAAGKPLLTNHGGWLRDVFAEADALMQVSTSPSREEMLVLSRVWPHSALRDAGARALHVGATRFNREKQSETILRIFEDARAHPLGMSSFGCSRKGHGNGMITDFAGP